MTVVKNKVPYCNLRRKAKQRRRMVKQNGKKGTEKPGKQSSTKIPIRKIPKKQSGSRFDFLDAAKKNVPNKHKPTNPTKTNVSKGSSQLAKATKTWVSSSDVRDAAKQKAWQHAKAMATNLTTGAPVPWNTEVKPMPPQGTLGSMAHGIVKATKPVSFCGSLYAVDPSLATPTSNVTSNVSFTFSGRGKEGRREAAKTDFLTIAKNPHLFVDQMPLIAQKHAVVPDTSASYKRKLNAIEKYWRKEFSTYSINDDFNTTVLSPRGENLFCAFVLYKAYQKRYTTNYIKSFRTAMNHLIRSLQGTPWQEFSMSSKLLKAIGRYLCKKSKGTDAIPLKILNIFLAYLQKNKTNEDFDLFCFAFACASRASEIINLTVKSFQFHEDNWEETPFVRIKFFGTKTHSSTPDDFHLITFYEKKDPTLICPYKIAKRLVQRAKARKSKYIAHMFLGSKKKTWESRSYHFYNWFRTLKIDFQAYLQNIRKWNYNVSNWRFHSVRTTFVGLLHTWGLSWTQIQVRTGHKFDSETTRNTYAMNALLTQGFDKSFESVLTRSKAARQLFTHPSLQQADAQRGIGATYALNVLAKPKRDPGRRKALNEVTEDLAGLTLGEDLSDKNPLDVLDIKHEEKFSNDYFVEQVPPALELATQEVLGQQFNPTGVVENLASMQIPERKFQASNPQGQKRKISTRVSPNRANGSKPARLPFAQDSFSEESSDENIYLTPKRTPVPRKRSRATNSTAGTSCSLNKRVRAEIHFHHTQDSDIEFTDSDLEPDPLKLAHPLETWTDHSEKEDSEYAPSEADDH